MIDSTFLRRLMYKMFLPVGFKVADIHIAQQQRPSLWWRFLNLMAHVLVFRYIRDRLGLSRVKVAYSGGGALSPDIIRYFRALALKSSWLTAPRRLASYLFPEGRTPS